MKIEIHYTKKYVVNDKKMFTVIICIAYCDNTQI